VCRKVGLAGVELAPFAGAHNLAGISDRGGPVEALAECVAHEGAWRVVVAAYARVYVSKELVPLRDRYASLQDA
jgi:delta-aminolevulinic acid dehydratase/porphobilinogen synthase